MSTSRPDDVEVVQQHADAHAAVGGAEQVGDQRAARYGRRTRSGVCTSTLRSARSSSATRLTNASSPRSRRQSAERPSPAAADGSLGPSEPRWRTVTPPPLPLPLPLPSAVGPSLAAAVAASLPSVVPSVSVNAREGMPVGLSGNTVHAGVSQRDQEHQAAAGTAAGNSATAADRNRGGPVCSLAVHHHSLRRPGRRDSAGLEVAKAAYGGQPASPAAAVVIEPTWFSVSAFWFRA